MSSHKDRMGDKCPNCLAGKFKEMSLYDDLDGKLTCSNCGFRIERWNVVMKQNQRELELEALIKEIHDIMKCDKITLMCTFKNHYQKQWDKICDVAAAKEKNAIDHYKKIHPTLSYDQIKSMLDHGILVMV